MTEGKNKAAILTEISLILAAIFWGTNYAATKFAALSIPPLSIVALRFVVGGLLMYAILRILEPGSSPGRKDLLRMAGLGCFGVVVAQTSFTFGVSMTTAANTGLIFATAPVWGLLLGLLLGLERPTWGGMVGVALSILGVAIVFWEGLSGLGGDLGRDLLVLLAAVGVERHSPLAVATYPIVFGGPLVLVLSIPLFTGLQWERVGVGAWAAVGFSIIFATAFSFSAWQRGISRIGANRVLVYQYLITITGVASGLIFFGEVLSIEKIVGGAIILMGVYLARRR